VSHHPSRSLRRVTIAAGCALLVSLMAAQGTVAVQNAQAAGGSDEFKERQTGNVEHFSHGFQSDGFKVQFSFKYNLSWKPGG